MHNLLELKNYLVKKYNPTIIIAYGSYARGEDTENSDIDLFIHPKIPIDLNEFEKKFCRKIHVIFKENLPKELKVNIINGIILYGVLTWEDLKSFFKKEL